MCVKGRHVLRHVTWRRTMPEQESGVWTADRVPCDLDSWVSQRGLSRFSSPFSPVFGMSCAP